MKNKQVKTEVVLENSLKTEKLSEHQYTKNTHSPHTHTNKKTDKHKNFGSTVQNPEALKMFLSRFLYYCYVTEIKNPQWFLNETEKI